MMFDLIFMASFSVLIVYGIWRFFRGLGLPRRLDGPAESGVPTGDPGLGDGGGH
jgi:hypothetical protein